MTKTRHLAIAVVLLLGMGVTLQVWRDEGWKPYEPLTPVMWLQASPIMDKATLGYDALASDVYWMRTVVYFGRQRLSTVEGKNYELLYPMLNLVTSLDPRFTVAYRFGAIFLSEQYPGGPGRPDLAIKLLERGMAADPTRWEYPHDIGFIFAWHYRDHKKAAEWFEIGSRVPGAPIWLKSSAAMMAARGGDRESARTMWRHIGETSEVGSLREIARVRMAQLDALDVIDALNEIVWRYKARVGRFPSSWQELLAARVLRRVPVDPRGVPYVLDAANENVALSRNSALWPLPEGLESSAK